MAFIGNTVQTQGFTPAVDYFSGNGSTVTFTLSRPVAAAVQVEAVIDNVVQNPSTAYTVSGNAITFTSAPLSGSNNIYVRYTSLITTYAAISQSPSVIGDITASGGYLAVGSFGNSFIDGTVVDYVTGNGRVTVGPADGLTIYNGGTSARSALAAWDSSGNLTNTGSIGSPASTALTLKSAGTTAVTIDTAQNVGIGTASPTSYGGGSTKFVVTGSGRADAWFVGGANAGGYAYFSNNAQNTYTNIFQIGQGWSSGSDNIGFLSTNGANPMLFATNGTERMRIDSSGNVFIATTSTPISGNTGQLNMSNAYNSGYFALAINSTTTSGNQNLIDFGRGGSQCGYIYSGATNSTSYLTSSDYRLKEDIQPMTGALAKVNALKPVTYKWKQDGTSSQGFIAHELAEVVPEAVGGEKDELDVDGNPRYQGIDTSFLVATLTAAIQELNAKVTALEAKLEAK